MDQVVPPQPQTPPQQTTTPKPHKSIMPIVLLVVGSIEIVLPLYYLFVTVPTVMAIYHQRELSMNPIETVGPAVFVVLVILLQLVFGAMLFMKQKQIPQLDDQDKKIAKILLICGGIMTIFGLGFSIAALLTPLYDFLSTLE